jgi:hypothetical protein
MSATHKDDRTLGEMFADLSREARTLIQHELQLAKIEMLENASKMRKGASLVTGGGLIAYGGVLAVIASAVLVLIAVGPSTVGGRTACRRPGGWRRLSPGSVRTRRTQISGTGTAKTLATLKEDLSWLKTQPK